jgi:very-short-patch-repair endonuclease
VSEFRPNIKRSARFSALTDRTLTRARELRASMSPPERKLWTRLRSRKLRGLRFRRQHPIGAYVLDFFCDEAGLAVELDGGHHAESKEHDERRDAWLAAQGIAVLRIPVPTFERDIPASLNRIAATCEARLPSSPSRVRGRPSPSSPNGGGGGVLAAGGGSVSTPSTQPPVSHTAPARRGTKGK